MKSFRYLRNVATLKLNQERCVGCGRCEEVCPHQVFTVATKKAQIDDLDCG